MALQRTAGNRAVARLVGCTYRPGERSSAAGRGILDPDVSLLGGLSSPYPASGDSVVVGDFAPNSANIKPSTRAELKSSWVGVVEPQTTQKYQILGFTDCVGDPANNKQLRTARAKAVADLFPQTAARASVVGPAADGDFLLPDNASPTDRAWNRSVLLGLAAPPPPPPPPPPSPAPVPPPKPDPSLITPKPPRSAQGCSPDQVTALSLAFPIARRLAEISLKVLKGDLDGVQRRALELYFGPDWREHLGDIRAGYQKILDEWVDWDEHSQCHLQTDAACPNKDPHAVTLAYVWKHGLFHKTPYGDVHVCRAAFNHTPEELGRTILHELSHRLDNTDDHKYCWPENGYCEDLPTDKAVDNADSYAQLALQLFNFLPT
ncbi:MAG TPA: M35 family metallo-endopeptidase [Solirubrobacteraceae bacterium]|nr:M35 family metallo-endopeptidase [Solirubrobacteraceae bacterium]